MALDELLAALEREAREEAARIRAAGIAESERITREADADLARRRRETLQEREAALRPAAQERLAGARQDGRRDVLAARQVLLDRVADAVRERLPGAECEPHALAARVRNALACVGDIEVEVLCVTALLPHVRELVSDRPHTTVTPHDDPGSALLVRAADGVLEIDASLTGLLPRYWPRLAIELVRELEVAA